MYKMKYPSNSLDKKIQKETKVIQKTSLKKNFPSFSINDIYISLYNEYFPLILQLTRFKFLDKINQEVDSILLNNSLKLSINNLQKLEAKEKMIKKYEDDYIFLTIEYNNFLKNKKRYNYFSHFRKHCRKTEKYGWHYCDKNKKGKFIEIKKNGEISYVICEGCKNCYSKDFIYMLCTNCNTKYFSNILKENENQNLLPATWNRYHCNSIINEIMKCIKCKNILYLNLSTGYLICLNKKCNFISKPEKISWICNRCGIEFSSSAKVYNPLEFQILNKSIKFALIKQIRAAPKKLPCGCAKDLSNLIFYHNEKCKGELYKGTLIDKSIIVCSECHAINFEDRFSWICPICGIKFHLHSLIGTKPFVIKKYVINKKFKKSGLNFSRNNENVLNKTNILSQKNDRNISLTKMNNKSLVIKDSISPIKNNILNNSNEKQIYSYPKRINVPKINIYQCKSNSNSNSNLNSFRKKEYKTLLDILNERKRFNSESKKEDREKDFNKKIQIIRITRNKEDKIKDNKELKLNNSYNRINEFHIHNSKEKISLKEDKSKEDNKEATIKGVSDTTDNSTFKTTSMYEPNKNKYFYNSIYNEINNNRNSIPLYSIWKINNPTNGRNIRQKYKRNNNKLKILNLTENDYSQNSLDSTDKFNNTINDNLNKYKQQFLTSEKNNDNNCSFGHGYKNNLINDNKKEKSDIKENRNESNKILYVNKAHYNNISSETNEKAKLFSSSSSSSEENEKDAVNSLPSSDEDEEKKDTIQDVVINRKNRRESLVLHGSFIRRGIILISQEKLLDLAKNTKIPSIEEKDYSYIKPIGEGTYGTVYMVENKETFEQFALKKIICRDFIELIKQKQELELLFSIKHENILNILGVQFKYLDETTSSINVLMELAKSDWNQEIKNRFLAKKYYKEKEIIVILKQIIKGFLFLQDKNIAHRDIKPQNILIFPNNLFKIADFGEAKFIKNIQEQSTLRGSELFMSPLLFNGYKYHKNNVLHNPFKSDVFSLGYCLLYAMCLNLRALDALRELYSMKAITNCVNKFLIQNYFSDKLINLLYKMIEPDENIRYDFEDLSKELSKF